MKTRTYLILYYLSLILTILAIGYAAYYYIPLFQLGESPGIIESTGSYLINNLLIVSIINFLLIIIFTILLVKKKNIVVNNLLLPVSYILFLIVIMIICHLFNDKVILGYIHYGYYQKFILIDYIIFNVYSILLFDFRKENKNEKKSKKK